MNMRLTNRLCIQATAGASGRRFRWGRILNLECGRRQGITLKTGSLRRQDTHPRSFARWGTRCRLTSCTPMSPTGGPDHIYIMLRLLFVIRRGLMQPNSRKFYDIAANLTDDQFSGKYYDKQSHHDDRQEVIERARQYGCEHLLIAAGNLEDAHKSTQICSQHPNCYSTIGVHPCRAKQPFNKHKWASVEQYFQTIDSTIPKMPHLVAIGECGLDYDRLEWSTKQQQLEVFPHHFALAEKYKLPMYLHNRNTGDDFYNIVAKNRDRFTTGVVHSFTGTKAQLDKILELDLYVGINGCSLKTQENLAVLKHIPVEKMMIETDSPYCEIKKSHKSYDLVQTKFESKAKEKKKPGQLVKGRNEPCKIVEVLEVVSKIIQVDPDQLAKTVFETSMRVLGPRQI